jgi:hypothetical protein
MWKGKAAIRFARLLFEFAARSKYINCRKTPKSAWLSSILYKTKVWSSSCAPLRKQGVLLLYVLHREIAEQMLIQEVLKWFRRAVQIPSALGREERTKIRTLPLWIALWITRVRHGGTEWIVNQLHDRIVRPHVWRIVNNSIDEWLRQRRHTSAAFKNATKKSMRNIHHHIVNAKSTSRAQPMLIRLQDESEIASMERRICEPW